MRRKRREGLAGFGILHVVLAAYVRCVAQYPGVNRFISGQRVFAREEIEVSLTIKPEMKAESPDTVLKICFQPTPRSITASTTSETCRCSCLSGKNTG